MHNTKIGSLCGLECILRPDEDTQEENVPRIHFQLQLAELKDKLLAMAALSQQAVQAAVDAWLQRDEALCQYVRENETAINTAQREVDEMAYELLSREQPMAIDLRFILAVIKINGDLERIGDMAVSIAIRTLDLLEQDPVDLPVDIAGMGDFAGRDDPDRGAGAAGWGRAGGRVSTRHGRRDRSHESGGDYRSDEGDPGASGDARIRRCRRF